MGESQTFLVVRARLNFWASWAVEPRLAMSATRVSGVLSILKYTVKAFKGRRV